MEYYHNPGKDLVITVEGRRYLRHGIRTHFVGVGEDYLSLFRRYVAPVYQPGDCVAVSEKVAALCQGRVVRREEVRVTPLARLLARCVHQTPAGPGMGLPVKMQFALDQEGRGKVLWAALRAGVDKLRGIHGTFYRLLGPEVRGLDGFYGEDIPAYADLGIRIPHRPDRLCDQVYQETGILSYIAPGGGVAHRRTPGQPGRTGGAVYPLSPHPPRRGNWRRLMNGTGREKNRTAPWSGPVFTVVSVVLLYFPITAG